MTVPVLTVVVTVVEGGAALERCLAALSTQADAPTMEVLVPFDDTIRAVSELAVRFPNCRFIDMRSRCNKLRIGAHFVFLRRC